MIHRPFFALSMALLAAGLLIAPQSKGAPQPIKVLLITGGCCHDYSHQKDILKKGIEARANATVDQIHTDDSSEQPPLAILGNPDYAKGYDLVIHDECGARLSDPEKVLAVLKPHRDGIPGVNLHCAMHSYRIGNPNAPITPGTPHGYWFEYLGIQSSGHGPQEPIEITFVDQESPITKGMMNWTTIKEELYNNVKVLTAHPLAKGKQLIKRKDGSERDENSVVVWTNEYGDKKTRVFSTTIGHNNVTVNDARYLDLVTRGMLWATGHLTADGKAAEGYGPAK